MAIRPSMRACLAQSVPPAIPPTTGSPDIMARIPASRMKAEAGSITAAPPVVTVTPRTSRQPPAQNVMTAITPKVVKVGAEVAVARVEAIKQDMPRPKTGRSILFTGDFCRGHLLHRAHHLNRLLHFRPCRHPNHFHRDHFRLSLRNCLLNQDQAH